MILSYYVNGFWFQTTQGELSSLYQQLDEVKAEKLKLEQSVANQLDEIRRLEFVDDRNRNLTEEVTGAEQKIKELQFKIRGLEREREKDHNAEDDAAVIEALKGKLVKLHTDKSELESQNKQFNKTIEELQDENDKLRRALNDSERMRMELRQRNEDLQQEILSLQGQMTSQRDRQTFRDFVDLKRELVAVKDDNDKLKAKLKTTSKGGKMGVLLPSLSADGRPPSGGDQRKDTRRKTSTTGVQQK